ncbi:hypothetical protein J32TS6_31000 [Virgibacillus pantothenticus]|uniref:hypothetical protein n=1 Tax=Virgibacillus TaxID=84406 RepID=UPI000953CA37|nr:MULTISPECIES: hypothetical protein [Virgibacillus]MBS7426928.1 hypothetical protein [Virgibacillus sp. 19R1-5]MED3735672.1 hypothetical protein [Virgibacillus pantothenticus]QTY15746.1 hypothetical protein KBP50_18055 [Virgibacillus pantothenticus]SIS96373.1 hypothetical protein SAMN05421787_10861 [Virgibacillus pantothenticus]GIP64545.1 hypothetical protein J32TS6_31000 [Virgibacillus pantothenticus]
MLDKRIAYYTKKVADFGSIHPSKRRNPYRHERLLLYKKLLHEKIYENRPSAFRGFNY